MELCLTSKARRGAGGQAGSVRTEGGEGCSRRSSGTGVEAGSRMYGWDRPSIDSPGSSLEIHHHASLSPPLRQKVRCTCIHGRRRLTETWDRHVQVCTCWPPRRGAWSNVD